MILVTKTSDHMRQNIIMLERESNSVGRMLVCHAMVAGSRPISLVNKILIVFSFSYFVIYFVRGYNSIGRVCALYVCMYVCMYLLNCT